jgi:hypothetical protein
MPGARHRGLAITISSISRRMSTAVADLPRRRRFTLDRRVQNLRKRSRCHRTVSGCTPRNVALAVPDQGSPDPTRQSNDVNTGR